MKKRYFHFKTYLKRSPVGIYIYMLLNKMHKYEGLRELNSLTIEPIH